MKNLFATTIIVLFAGLSASAETEFYQCTLPQAEEYRVGIDIKNNIAGFFDNDTTSIMKYRGLRQSTSNSEHIVLIFTGKDSGGEGDLKLEFNTAKKRIRISTVETDGTIELLAFASCAKATPWDWSSEDLSVQ